MHVWSIAALLATWVPLVALLAWIRPPFLSRWRQSAGGARVGFGGLWLLGSLALLAFPHDDSFTGLDNMTYRQMAHAFRDGRGFRDVDPILAQVPEELRENFLLHRGPRGRPTRDRAFQLAGWKSAETRPFFMPALPLAAAAPGSWWAPERFVPVTGALWWALVLAAGFCAGGAVGLVVVAALAFATAWPAWFLRGFYAEGVGAMLVAGVVAAASVRPWRDGRAAWAGFALGWAVTYHPTLVVLSAPVALGLLLEWRSTKTLWAMLAGLLAGVLPFWALTRWVCQPYGDWTRWSMLREMIWGIPEHRAIALALGLLAFGAPMVLWAGFRPGVRAAWRRLDERFTPWGWVAVSAIPLVLIGILPPLAEDALRKGAGAVWSGIRWPCALAWILGAVCIWKRPRPIRERAWLAALLWGSLLFLFIQGVETPVGLWSQRRFLPVLLTGIALLAAPLSAELATWRGAKRWGGILLLLVAGAANAIRWPAAFFTVNERSATEWTQSVAGRLGTDRWVVFDYYPHSVPYAVGLQHRVVGLGETSWRQWPAVARWLAGVAQAEEAWLATSWAPCPLEEGFRLEPVFSTTGRFPVVTTKGFFPAEPGWRTVENHFLRVVPLKPGAPADQDKVLDGGPVGLRGPWGAVRKGAAWTRQGSGIIGPVPDRGQAVVFEAECAWMPPSEDWSFQTLRIRPPWGGRPVRVEVPAGEQRIRAVLARPAGDREREPAGSYTLRVDRPYDPAASGLRGYAADLGVPLRRIIIRVEPGGSSVPN